VISVIVPVRNGMPWLEEQVRALAAQKCSEPWEVVLADNGSNDGSHEFARSWAAEHENFQLVDASARAGAPSARNIAVQAANGELLAFCDADDVVLAGWLEACASGLKRADVVAGVFDFWSLNAISPSPPMPAAIRQLGFLPAGLGANLAVRREAFEKVNGFNEEPLPGEDIDLCWRLQLQGFQFDVAGLAVVAKRERAEFKLVFRQAYSYGRCGPVLYRRYRHAGARRDLAGAFKSWGWLVISIPQLLRPERRIEWARTAGMRLGRLNGSAEERVFFP
jgi:glycosyltransferase involved in cell wall biosynthesis